MTPIDPDATRLRAPRQTDIAAHAAYPVSSEILRMYGGDPDHPPAPGQPRSQRWYDELMAQPHPWVIENDGRALGSAFLHSVAPTDRNARMAIGLWSKDHLGLGIGRRAVSQVLDEAFGALGLHRIDLRVLAFNTRAIRCYRACGFTHEGTLRHAARIGQSWHDDWIMSILDFEHGDP